MPRRPRGAAGPLVGTVAATASVVAGLTAGVAMAAALAVTVLVAAAVAVAMPLPALPVRGSPPCIVRRNRWRTRSRWRRRRRLLRRGAADRALGGPCCAPSRVITVHGVRMLWGGGRVLVSPRPGFRPGLLLCIAAAATGCAMRLLRGGTTGRLLRRPKQTPHKGAHVDG